MLERLRRSHPAVRCSIIIGAITMLCLYITALFAYSAAPYGDYSNAMIIYNGCLEAAPASLASGVIGGLIGDLILGSRGGD
ncbi:MAG: hypothetical protein FWH02_08840 [Oscillospiraceae bacterium]|nr:hypothetical protein [Oscillospiraceae bacterium]